MSNNARFILKFHSLMDNGRNQAETFKYFAFCFNNIRIRILMSMNANIKVEYHPLRDIRKMTSYGFCLHCCIIFHYYGFFFNYFSYFSCFCVSVYCCCCWLILQRRDIVLWVAQSGELFERAFSSSDIYCVVVALDYNTDYRK